MRKWMCLPLTFSSKLDWRSYIIYIAKTPSKKIQALIRSMKFLSHEIALYLYKSTIGSCMEYYCHVWVGAPSCLYRYYFGRCSSELGQLVALPYSQGRCTRYSYRLRDFLSPILDFTRMSMSAVFFLAQLDPGILCL